MAKRFTDTDKWKKKFIRGLKGPYKLLFLYILDDCDHAGIWHVDVEVAGIRIGEAITEEGALEAFNSHIIAIDDGEKWFVPDFIDFQYGELNPNNRVHLSVINQLKKYNIKGLISPLQGVKDKDKDKDKDKEKEKEKEGAVEIYPTFTDFWDLYDKKVGDQTKLKKKWIKLHQDEREQIMEYIPHYRVAEPQKQFRKNPETFLNNKSWNDEIINTEKKSGVTVTF